MSAQTEMLKDCSYRIRILTLMLEKEPENSALQRLLDEEKTLYAEIKSAN